MQDTLHSCNILTKSEISRYIFGNYSIIKCHENRPSGCWVFLYEQTDMTKLIVACRNFANAPKNGENSPRGSVWLIWQSFRHQDVVTWRLALELPVCLSLLTNRVTKWRTVTDCAVCHGKSRLSLCYLSSYSKNWAEFKIFSATWTQLETASRKWRCSRSGLPPAAAPNGHSMIRRYTTCTVHVSLNARRHVTTSTVAS
jgi:hypothetical protein